MQMRRSRRGFRTIRGDTNGIRDAKLARNRIALEILRVASRTIEPRAGKNAVYQGAEIKSLLPSCPLAPLRPPGPVKKPDATI